MIVEDKSKFFMLIRSNHPSQCLFRFTVMHKWQRTSPTCLASVCYCDQVIEKEPVISPKVLLEINFVIY